MAHFPDPDKKEIDRVVQASWKAFQEYRTINLQQRAEFLESIASELEAVQEELVVLAAGETHLEPERLRTEFKRTLFQLRSYGEACARGTWLDVRIDTADTKRRPPKPDLRKMLVPLGPVVVFGASNFPFAYSTAGGDTACALAAGCTVIVKGHPAHAQTSEKTGLAISLAAQKSGLLSSVFTHLHGKGFETGKMLVEHPLVKAAGFTGSLEGGRALYDIANQRPVPIPFFAEMGSVNPVFLLPGKLQEDADKVAAIYADSITMSGGQFCTNPGLLVGIKGESLDRFVKALADKMKSTLPVPMLHEGIAQNFRKIRSLVLEQEGVEIAATITNDVRQEETIPTLARAQATQFLQNPVLHKEVFGPFSLLVECRDMEEMKLVPKAMEGQLTTTVMASEEDLKQNEQLIPLLQSICGRLILNGVPTGVEVALGMHHGGPYPATTDSRFTAVGADGIRRFARPVCYQNWTDAFLPEELKNENPLGLWRTVNNELTRATIPEAK